MHPIEGVITVVLRVFDFVASILDVVVGPKKNALRNQRKGKRRK